MKSALLFLICYLCLTTLSNAQTAPLSIEDTKMDAQLMGRKPAKLTIKLTNLPDSVKKVAIKYTLVQFGSVFQADHFSETDQSGVAKIVLDQKLPLQQIWLSVGDYFYAGIFVNTGLAISLDVKKLPKDGAYMIGEGVVYSGADGEINTVLNKNVLFKKAEKEALFNTLRAVSQSRTKYNADIFIGKVDSIREALTRIDNEFSTSFQSYAWAVNNETLSQVYGQLCLAYGEDAMPEPLFNEIKNHQPYFTSNEGVLFYMYLTMYTYFKNRPTLDRNLILLDSLYTQQKADVLKLMLLYKEKDVYAQSYAKIINSIKTPWSKSLASNELMKANINQKRIDSLLALSVKLEKTIIGTPLLKMPFDAELYKIDEIKNIDDFIVSLKQKFPNKALVIDFWATWCEPCLSDLPSSKKLHEGNKDLDIEYIYLCTSSGSDLDKWKTKVADLQIPGTHFFMNEKLIAQLTNMLNASAGYPAYVTIDSKGKINSKVITRMDGLNRESLKASVGL
jgi:thiol-disulfide isomerase/thioredoxin